MSPKERRWMICRLDEATTLRLLRGELTFPADTRLEAVHLEDGLLCLRLYHRSFPQVPAGDVIPPLPLDNLSGGPHVDGAH